MFSYYIGLYRDLKRLEYGEVDEEGGWNVLTKEQRLNPPTMPKFHLHYGDVLEWMASSERANIVRYALFGVPTVVSIKGPFESDKLDELLRTNWDDLYRDDPIEWLQELIGLDTVLPASAFYGTSEGVQGIDGHHCYACLELETPKKVRQGSFYAPLSRVEADMYVPPDFRNASLASIYLTISGTLDRARDAKHLSYTDIRTLFKVRRRLDRFEAHRRARVPREDLVEALAKLTLQYNKSLPVLCRL
jgi:hypothetical protein